MSFMSSLRRYLIAYLILHVAATCSSEELEHEQNTCAHGMYSSLIQQQTGMLSKVNLNLYSEQGLGSTLDKGQNMLIHGHGKPAQSTSNSEISFLLLCSMLVQVMTPALAFFYSGLCRPSGVCTMMAKSVVSMGVISMLWFFFVFGMAFGKPWGYFNLIGNPLSCLGLSCANEFDPLKKPGNAGFYGPDDLPGWLFAFYQNKFAVITPALVSGALADRISLGPWILFLCIWSIIVYAPWCHSIWGGGYYGTQGVQDFAGGIVVHTTSGWSALAVAKALGPRTDPDNVPHSVPLVVLGTALLWFGWFGFNGGSAYAPNGVAVTACLNSQLAACSAMLAWAMLHFTETRKLGVVPLCVGSIAGLAAITPAAGFVQPIGAVLIGFVASVVCYSAIHFCNGLGVDDALDVWAVHGVGGSLGSILLGLLADPAVCLDLNKAPAWCINPGTVASSGYQFLKQTEATIICAVYSASVSYALIFVLMQVFQVHPSNQADLDFHELGEQAYSFAGSPSCRLVDSSPASAKSSLPLQ